MSMDELPDKLREALEASVRRARVLQAAENIVQREVRRIVRADTGEVIGEISYGYEIGPRDYVPEYDEVVPGACTQCAPGHDGGDGRCARHGKEIDNGD